jgi:hypothetical protein
MQSHLPRKVTQNNAAIGQFDAKEGVGQTLNDFSFDLDVPLMGHNEKANKKTWG